MGVSGCGKTTLGSLLAERLQLPFMDADDSHPASNIEKMRQGIALDDADRGPWLKLLANHLKKNEATGVVLACSALKQCYRDQLTAQVPEARFLYLQGSFSAIYQRMQERNHFMPRSLLQSQFDTLEEPRDAIILDASLDLDTLVTLAVDAIRASD